ncbi:hypothetical protein [Gluconobacter frateurii]|uniref:Uncharacterized protein n=1 Tax=Gluconobacter frateurii NRIC 0228 TaxID=1307946 RepID=A0ABQ0QAG1_9PROT|nr:hypothetical protein [Gluconobacter frateurii]GBR10856.1 hypothetical protein AA0228_1189 [Gluconobacter frateurii NRIC 0228]GLP91441.1 hypothetical protein GCM10007868_25160 [Gluconobacter frateurii]
MYKTAAKIASFKRANDGTVKVKIRASSEWGDRKAIFGISFQVPKEFSPEGLTLLELEREVLKELSEVVSNRINDLNKDLSAKRMFNR